MAQAMAQAEDQAARAMNPKRSEGMGRNAHTTATSPAIAHAAPQTSRVDQGGIQAMASRMVASAGVKT